MDNNTVTILNEEFENDKTGEMENLKKCLICL